MVSSLVEITPSNTISASAGAYVPTLSHFIKRILFPSNALAMPNSLTPKGAGDEAASETAGCKPMAMATSKSFFSPLAISHNLKSCLGTKRMAK